MHAANVRRMPSGSPLRWLATWRGPSVPRIVTVVSPGPAPSSVASVRQGAGGVCSGTTSVYLPGWPSDDPSISPVRAPNTFMATRRTARPIVALARLPGPRAPCCVCMPSLGDEGAADDEAQRCAAGGRHHRVGVEALVEHGPEPREHDGEVLGPASGHDGVDRRLLGREVAAALLDRAEDIGCREPARREHLLHALRRGRDDRQAVGPLPLEVLLLDIGFVHRERLGHGIERSAGGSFQADAERSFGV